MDSKQRYKSFSELEERTLVVKNLDTKLVDKELLMELFKNFGPVKNIVLKNDHAFVEYNQKVSVAYAFAMLTDICLYGRRLNIYPKLQYVPYYYKYQDSLKQFQNQCHSDPKFMEQYMDNKQLSEWKKTENDMKNSHRKKNAINDRLYDYQFHYCGAEKDLKTNPYFTESFSRDNHRSSPGIIQHVRDQHHSSKPLMRPEFDGPPPSGTLYDRPPPLGPLFDRPPPPGPLFDRPPPPGPLFDRAPPPGPLFDRAPPPGPLFDRPPPPEPLFDRAPPPGPLFDRPPPSPIGFGEHPGFHHHPPPNGHWKDRRDDHPPYNKQPSTSKKRWR